MLEPVALLIVYAIGITLASLGGGQLSILGSISHFRTQVIVTFVAGFILGMAIFHLLPHAIEYANVGGDFATVTLWIMVSIFVSIVLLKVFDFHQHELEANTTGAMETRQKTSPHSLFGIVLGLSLHTVTEGVALGTSLSIGLGDSGLLPSLGVFLAILLHKPLDAYSITALMRNLGHSSKRRFFVNCSFALICPVVAICVFLSIGNFENIFSGPLIGSLLAFAVGSFLCIALYDLLPKISFQKHHKGVMLGILFVGIGLSYLLFYVEKFFGH